MSTNIIETDEILSFKEKQISFLRCTPTATDQDLFEISRSFTVSNLICCHNTIITDRGLFYLKPKYIYFGDNPNFTKDGILAAKPKQIFPDHNTRLSGADYKELEQNGISVYYGV